MEDLSAMLDSITTDVESKVSFCVFKDLFEKKFRESEKIILQTESLTAKLDSMSKVSTELDSKVFS